MATPRLTGDALAAVKHRGSHLQIIAGAGSGKTEVVSQRVADLLASDVDPSGIVAFTFTERAATELKNRIAHRVEDRLGGGALDRLGGLFVGTIHAFCFRLLQQHAPEYESYDVLDDNQLTAFLGREASRLNLKALEPSGRLFRAITLFRANVDVLENELLDPTTMPEPFRTTVVDYLAALKRYRLLTYGQQVVRAVSELERPEVGSAVRTGLRHLIVDEYQDVNPAQERLIRLLTGPDVELCVVGDDDQAIYQWRGSDVANIVSFVGRYRDVATFEITKNRRSRPAIIAAANRFAMTIPGRIPKQMHRSRPGVAGRTVVTWSEEYEADEAARIAHLVAKLRTSGVPYSAIAILVRGRVAYPHILEALAASHIPVQPGGRTGLFQQPEALALGKAIAWLTDLAWREGFGWGSPVNDADLFDEFTRAFGLTAKAGRHVGEHLKQWKACANSDDKPADLVAEYYSLLADLDVAGWDLSDPIQVNRVGTLARFSSLLADYETVRRRARPDPNAAGEQVGGTDRGTWYYRNLGIHILNYAFGAYEGFDGEPDFALDAVDLTTVHRAKGLEWPAVFVPSLTKKRFPSSKTGTQQPWLVPRTAFGADRYEGSDADERRLFYVAMTRARDWLSLSRHDRVTKNKTAPSRYWQELSDEAVAPDEIVLPSINVPNGGVDDPITVSYSEMAQFLDCGMAYRLRTLMGFQPRLAPELGYGKAVHHVLRTIADVTKSSGSVPSERDIDDVLDTDFFLPTASKAAHRQLKAAARRLVTNYTREHDEDLFRVWETERPFELHLNGVTVAGRADVILDREGGVDSALAILDYKTSTDTSAEHHLQLQVYTDAGRREGLDVEAAYVHDLRAGAREAVPIDTESIASAERTVSGAARELRARRYRPNPGSRCRSCEVRAVCGAAAR